MRPLFFAVLVFLVGCGAGSSKSDAGSDAGTQTDGGSDAGQPACVKNPVTHLELINACTTAQAIDKHPVLPLLQADGSLPPLP